jgi:hypothetical protein
VAQTLFYKRDFQVLKFGVAIGYNVAKLETQPTNQTESIAPVIDSSSDPLAGLFGRYNNNPRWADFPRWLKEYRSKLNQRERELVP